MSKYNELAKDPKYAEIIADWNAKRAPIIYFYGPTGVGKTHLIGTLLKHLLSDGTRPYAPVLYIDGDNGAETIADAAETPELCTLRSFEGRYDTKLAWFFSELLEAERTECGAIVVEGFNALYKSMLTPKMRDLPVAEGVEAWQAHNEPAQRMDTVFEAVKELKQNRKHAGCGVPIFVTLNVREVNQDTDNARLGKMFTPNLSPNRIRAAMSTADAFIELQRETNTVMLCKPDSYNKFRKLRRANVASLVEDAMNLTLPGLLALWAYQGAKAHNKLGKELALAPSS